MPVLKGLIFDLDGTLVDSAADIRQALNLLLAEHQRRPLTLDEVKRSIGDGAIILIERVFALTGEPVGKDSFPLVQRYVTHLRNIAADPEQIFPEVVSFLERCLALGIKLGVCTNKQEAATHKLLDDLKLSRFFSAIAGGDTYMVHKPNPGHVLGVAETMAVAPADCVMVGDSVNDVRAAHGAGMPCIVVTQGYGLEVEELGADRLIEGFADLPAALAELGYALPGL